MPQDGSNNYQYPPGTPGIPDTTIESEAYNTFLDDLVTNDLNIPRPIHRGGTGATNALQAMTNLGGEIANQVVANYDTFPFKSGSFMSLAGATSEPFPGNHTNGFCTVFDANSAVLIAYQAGGVASSRKRVKAAGVWGAWETQPGSAADMDAAYVNISGDTMTGNLYAPMLVSNGSIYAGAALTTGTYHFGNTGSKYLVYDGTNFNFVGGSTLSVSGAVMSSQGTGVGTYYFGSSGTKYLNCDGTNFNLRGGEQLSVDTSIQIAKVGASDGVLYFHDGATNRMGLTFVTATGRSTMIDLYSGQGVYIDPGGAFTFTGGTAYKTGGGAWAATSDARIKTVIGDYKQGLDEVIKLHPVTYVYKGNDTPTGNLDRTDLEGKVVDASSGEAPYPASGHYGVAKEQTPFVGFVAQELEQVFPGMVSESAGFIDGQAVTDLKNVDTSALIYALVNSVKTLVARIEALEAKA
jgi:hypothetical protein